jgi:DNA-binding response OmpR family regulator
MVKGRITIIEDDNDLRSLIKLTLQAAGYEVIAYSGGYGLFNSNDDATDIYIIDLNLEGKSGLELCRIIKEKTLKKNIPVIIIMSAHPDVQQLAMEVCANDTLSKPFSSKDLLSKMSEYLPQTLAA